MWVQFQQSSSSDPGQFLFCSERQMNGTFHDTCFSEDMSPPSEPWLFFLILSLIRPSLSFPRGWKRGGKEQSVHPCSPHGAAATWPNKASHKKGSWVWREGERVETPYLPPLRYSVVSPFLLWISPFSHTVHSLTVKWSESKIHPSLPSWLGKGFLVFDANFSEKKKRKWKKNEEDGETEWKNVKMFCWLCQYLYLQFPHLPMTQLRDVNYITLSVYP